MRQRLDAELVRRGLVPSRTEAQEAVRAGLVTVAGRPAMKPAMLVDTGEPLHIEAAPRDFVSRGGEKLAAALDRFAIDPEGLDCLDAGASTGGFTDCLLQRGASRVAAIDVGYGQLAWSLRNDERVTVLERTNVRGLVVGDVPFRPEVVVADLSFISLRLVIPALVAVAAPGAIFVFLVKPQFEAGVDDVGKGGVVRDPNVWRRAIEGVISAAGACGLAPVEVIASPLVGPAGNVEFLLHLASGAGIGADGSAKPAAALDLLAALEEGTALRSHS